MRETQVVIAATDGTKYYAALARHENPYTAWKLAHDQLCERFGHMEWSIVCDRIGDAPAQIPVARSRWVQIVERIQSLIDGLPRPLPGKQIGRASW